MIFLTSAGIFDVKDDVWQFFPKPLSKLRVAHIITAAKPEKDISYLENERRELLAAGFLVEDVDIEGKKENELKKILTDKDIIYVQGGNTFYLLKCIKESGFEKVAREMLERGAIYIGVSAGSYVACPTIEMAEWKHQDKNFVGLIDLTAMNLVPFLVVAHYRPEYRELIKRGMEEAKYPVRILTDDQAILVKDGEIRLLGGEEIKI